MITDMTYPFHLPALPYSYDALEPFIDQRTMHLHHDKHFKTYIDQLNAALNNAPQYHSWTLTKLLTDLKDLPAPLQTAVRNHGGGAFAHDLYFDLMSPPGQEISLKILNYYDSDKQFFSEMKTSALSLFGSGSVWLVLRPDGSLDIISLPNQDTPLTHGLYPILTLDIWEHAYYLKHQNLRSNYVDNWFHVINWEAVTNRMLTGF